MPIDHERKIILIHIPKNGGTSVEKSLGMTATGHRIWQRFRDEFPKEWATYRRIAIVRDPLDRLISCYEYARMDRSYWHAADGGGTYGKHPDYDVCRERSFQEVVSALLDGRLRLWHDGWRPQYDWIYDGELLVDDLIPMEHLDSWLSGWGIEGDTRLNPSDRPHDQSHYFTEELARRAMDHFAADVALYRYASDNPPLRPLSPWDSRRGVVIDLGTPSPGSTS